MKTLKDAIEIIMAEPPEMHYPAYFANLLSEADVPDKNAGKCSEIPNSSDTISRQAAIEHLKKRLYETELNSTAKYPYYEEIADNRVDTWMNEVPSSEPDEKLEKCRFEYINACRIVTFPTPDTTKKDISDAYAVIKALQPIFGDVTF